jgi:hypothetical protein
MVLAGGLLTDRVVLGLAAPCRPDLGRGLSD